MLSVDRERHLASLSAAPVFDWGQLKPPWSLQPSWRSETLAWPPIFVVSVPNSKRRMRRMTEQLSTQSLPFVVVPGIFGDETLRKQYSMLYQSGVMPRSYVPHPRNLAVALSHMRLYDQILQQNISQALILEDDVLLTPHLMTKLRKLLSPRELPTAFKLFADVLYLGWNRHLCRPQCTPPVPNRPDLVRLKRSGPIANCITSGTYGYWISRRGARHSLERLRPLRDNLDLQLGVESAELVLLATAEGYDLVNHNWTVPSIRVKGTSANVRRQRQR